MEKPSHEPVLYPEASPDVEVSLKITGLVGEGCQMQVACINISKTTADLKKFLSACFGIDVEDLQIWKRSTMFQDNVTLMDYDISPDDILEVRVTCH